MLSKKMAVSLTSLITIFALAFVVPSALAQDFDAAFSVDDVSFADGNQVELTADGPVKVHIKFGEVVSLADVEAAFGADAAVTDKNGHVDILNYYGAIIDSTTEATANTLAVSVRETDIDASPANRRNDGKNFTLTINRVPNSAAETSDRNEDAYKIRVFLAEGAIGDANPDSAKKSKKASITFDLVGADPDPSAPMPISIALAPGQLIPHAGFTGDTLNVIVTLSEQAKENKFTKAHLTVDKGTASDGVYLDGVANSDATGRTGMYHRYLVTITPKAEDGDLIIKLNAFEDNERRIGTGDEARPGPNEWMPDPSALDRVEGTDMLTVKIKKKVDPVKTAGLEVKLLNEGIIPANGYLVIAKNKGDSAVRNPGDAKKTPANPPRQPFALTYNLIDGGLPNLETFLINGGTIDLVAPQKGLVISEIMWGSDASITDSFKSQWIEIRNTSGAEIKMGDGTHKLLFYPAGSVLPDVSTVSDRVGTVGAGGYWSIVGKGESGRTGIGESPGDAVAVTPTKALVSMQRSITATGVAADGTMASSWAASVSPASNFELTKEGMRIGSPGVAPVMYPATPTPDPEPAPIVPVPVAGAADIDITEIMVDTGNGRLPQWIELTNTSGAEKSLAGWSLTVANSDADADVIGSTVSINLSGTIGVGGGEGKGGTMGKSIVLAAGTARSSSSLDKQVMDVSSQLGQKGRYKLISDMAFLISLIPPQKTGILTPGDQAGNLDATTAWDIPMDANGRSSLIRVTDNGMKGDGTDASGWILASSTALVGGPTTWYGSDEDAGTPGYDAGGPLPVELSHFRPARDKATGAVVITWSTQSELNNAGFFIKRSQQRDGEFKVINPTLIAGAGTTSEKQTYTYTDTTAQPNVVYYYQIEDVSLDGQRQTLTLGTRLKGHIGAAGKLTSTWGELKSSNE